MSSMMNQAVIFSCCFFFRHAEKRGKASLRHMFLFFSFIFIFPCFFYDMFNRLAFFFFLLSFLWIFYLLCFFMCHGVEVYIYICVCVCVLSCYAENGALRTGCAGDQKKSGRENAMVRGNRAERHRSTAVLFFVAFFSFSGVVEVSHYYPMDVSVVLAADVLSSSDTRHALILVGQRSVAGGSGNQERAVCIVSDAIPCTDMDVIMEQVECLEQVLPCGIAFLGVFLPGDGVKDLAALRHSLSSHLQVSFFFVAKYDNEGRVQCRLLQSGRMLSVTTPDTKPVLVTLACYFFYPLGQFPFIVRSKDENITSNVVLDVTSTALMEHNQIWDSVDALYAVQLGSTEGQEKDMLCVHVTFFPFLSCGQGVYRAICTLLPKVERRPQCVMVRVGSRRYPSLVYQWIFTPTERGSAAPSVKQWDELKELIEDGVGEEVQPSQVVTDTFLGVPSATASTTIKGSKNVRNKTQKSEVSNTFQREKTNGDFLRYIPPLLVLFCSLFLYFCCTK